MIGTRQAIIAGGTLAGFILAGGILAIPGSPASAQTNPGEIKGQDVMGDKSRSATDGWVQAPIPREESASKDAPNPGGRSTAENANRPVPAANPSPSLGEDPLRPAGDDTASPAK